MKSARRGFLVLLLLVTASAGIVSAARRGSAATAASRELPPRALAVSVDGESSGRTAVEEAAVQRALRGRLRAAADEDAEQSDSRSGLESLYTTYHPYFVRGDLNEDGRLDFAQAFVRLGSGEAWFDVAVFFGTADGFGEPVYVEKGLRLESGDLSIERTLLVVTPDLGYDETRRWRFDASLKRFVDADAVATEPEEDESPEESPDSRLRIRV
jgi:hypothetical protein